MNMFKGFTKKKKKNSFKRINRKVNFFLSRSFFSIDELLTLNKKRSIRTLIKIFKTEKQKISLKEAKQIIQTLQKINNKKKIKLEKLDLKQILYKFFKFSKKTFVKKIQTFVLLFENFFQYIFNFSLDFQQILRN